MTTPVTATHTAAPTTSLSLTTAATTSRSGLSSVTDSISSAPQGSEGFFSSAYKTVTYPFVFISVMISNSIKGMMAAILGVFGFASKTVDHEKIAFITDHINSLTGNDLVEALDKFSHISNPKEKLNLFQTIQSSVQVDAAVTKAFFDLLPVDVINHLERHIWIENGRNDDGFGMQYGRNIINTDIKGDLVVRALRTCSVEK